MGKIYTKEFRAEAIKLMGEIGRKETVKRLKISDWSLRQWEKTSVQSKKEKSEEESQSWRTKMRDMEEKIKELEKENARMEKENEFLEEAARFFAGSRQK